MVGLVLLAARVLRLGFVANFISEPVLVGFKSGIGFVIVVDQLPKLLGVHIEKTGFSRHFRDLAHLPQTSLATLAVSAAIVVLIFGLERVVPRIPAPLVAVAAAIGASALLDLPAHGVATVGQVPTGLPSVTWPNLALVHALWPAAVGIALMSFTESIAAARAFAERDEPLPEPNRELFALGVANATGGLLGAMPAGGGTSQTAINRLAGARSQGAELHRCWHTRHAAAAGANDEVDAAGGARGGRHPVLARVDTAPPVPCDPPGTHDGVPLVPHRVRGCHSARHVAGIVVAVIDSLLSLANQAYNSPLYAVARKRGTAVFRSIGPDHPQDESWPGLLLLRIEGRLFFANAQRVADLIRSRQQHTRAQVLAIDCSAVIDVEYTAIKVLEQLHDKLRRNGCELWFTGMTQGVFEVVERSGIGAKIGHERMFLNLQAAVEAYERRGGHESD